MSTNRKTIKTFGNCRVIHFYGEINEKMGRECINRLIHLDKKSNKDILLVIDSIGGDVDVIVSIYQVIQLLRCKVGTLCLSNANSAAAILLACGEPGKRMVMAQSIVMLHDISSEFNKDYHSVLENEINSLRLSRTIINNMLKDHGAENAIKFIKPEATYLCGEDIVKNKLADIVVKKLDDILKVVKI